VNREPPTPPASTTICTAEVFHPVRAAPPYAAPVDRLNALRAPLTVVALVVLTVVAAARVVLGLSEVATVGGSRAVAAARLAPNAGDAALTVLVGVLVAACFLGPALPARRRLAAWGSVLTVVSLVATLVALGLTDLTVAGWNLVWSLPDLAVPVVVGLALLALARPEPGRAEAPAAVTQGSGVPVDEPEPEPDPELQPSWTQDTAAGAVWSRAGDAARGAPAQGWGTSGGAGWASDDPSTPAVLPAGRGEDQVPTDRS